MSFELWYEPQCYEPWFKSNPAEEARLAEQAKTFPVTKCPYSGERSSLRFDRRTHTPWKRRPMNTAGDLGGAGISCHDWGSMHMERRATANEMRLHFTPEFSANDDQLRLVIAQQGYDYIRGNLPEIEQFYGTQRVPNGFVLNHQALEELARKVITAKKLIDPSNQKLAHFRHIIWCEAHGGYVALRATIAYRAWREAKDSGTIAEELGMSWVAVRQILNRLVQVGAALGFKTFPHHHSYKGKGRLKTYDQDLTGQRIGSVEVIAPWNGIGHKSYLCHCDCGRDVIVHKRHLRQHKGYCFHKAKIAA